MSQYWFEYECCFNIRKIYDGDYFIGKYCDYSITGIQMVINNIVGYT